MESIWDNTAEIKEFEPLQRDISTDVLIIGGGLAGILCAYMLKNAGIDCVLVEAKRIAGGITRNTTAKITSQHGLVYRKLIREFDDETARLYLRANQEAVEQYKELCENIDCDFEIKDNFVYSLDGKEKIESEINALKRMGYDASFESNLPLPFKTDGAICFHNQAQFNPMKFIAGIAGELNIFENTAVREIIGTTAKTDKHKIKAKKIIVATHFPFINKHGMYFLKMHQHRSYVIAYENAPDFNGMYVDESDSGMSFRNYKDLLLIGGGGHRTGKQGGAWAEIEAFSAEHFPQAKEKYRWATQDCETLDKVPYIGRYSQNTENLYVATGFNKWGMTSSMVAANLLCDLIREKHSPYESVFYPSRTILRGELLKNSSQAVVNLLTPTVPRCPHLGCALKWNSVEHTWDCPCHGSRFEEKGKLIDNPSTGDLKSKRAHN